MICANASCCNSNGQSSRNHWNSPSYAILWKPWAKDAFRKSPGERTAASLRCRNRCPKSPRLEPRPGRAFLPDTDQYVLPEVFVIKNGEDFTVTTNDEYIPHLRISNVYKDLMAQGENSSEVKNYIREKIRAGKISHQKPAPAPADHPQHCQGNCKTAAGIYGEGLFMPEANDDGANRGSGGRARNDSEPGCVRQIHMQTPQGIFEMRFFFTAGLQTASGDGVSNTSVKDMIADIFKNEDAAKPLSDQEVL